jgi:predicted ATPase
LEQAGAATLDRYVHWTARLGSQVLISESWYKQLWLMPEALRIKGEILLVSQANAEARAADCFARSKELASGQGALAWELRAATNLARLLYDQGRSEEARDTLQPVYRRFTEGFATADLRLAKALLDAIG